MYGYNASRARKRVDPRHAVGIRITIKEACSNMNVSGNCQRFRTIGNKDRQEVKLKSQ